MLLHVPLPVARVHARAAPVRLLARMMTPHVLDDLRAPAAAKVAPVAQEVARLFLDATRCRCGRLSVLLLMFLIVLALVLVVVLVHCRYCCWRDTLLLLLLLLVHRASSDLFIRLALVVVVECLLWRRVWSMMRMMRVRVRRGECGWLKGGRWSPGAGHVSQIGGVEGGRRCRRRAVGVGIGEGRCG